MQKENQIIVDGLTFIPYLNCETIRTEVERVGKEIARDYEGKQPIFLCVLTGAFVFASDLIRATGLTDSKITFIRYKSYEGTSSSGSVKQITGLTDDISGRDVVIIEDIVDTGLTACRMIEDLKKQNPTSVKFATLLYKPESSQTGFVPDYVAFKIPPKFIIGYGLDLDGKARNLPDIYVIKEG
ncbi:MAG: hypoxanthine phosphoribosyltransferase [Muribaculaceae bacterium]|nr:hypoxanthine phosphoribosyltransferase [Muribaculaceae bacterium]